MNKVKALELLFKQKESIEAIKPLEESSKKFQEWREQTKVVIKAIFGITSDYYKRFDALLFYPGSPLMPIIGNKPRSKPSEAQKKKAYLDGLEYCDTMLTAMITEIEIWEDDDHNGSSEYAINTVQVICNHFHQAVRQIRKRHENRSTIDVNDEYDV